MKKNTLFTLLLTVSVLLLASGCGVFGGSKAQGIKTSAGEIVVGDQVNWPDSSMGGLNKPNANIVTVIKDNGAGSCAVAFSGMSSDTAAQYIANLKQQGYQAVVEMNDEDGLIFSGTISSGASVLFTYTNATQEGTITYTPNQESASVLTENSTEVSATEISEAAASEITASEAVDMTDVSPWPDGFLPGVPELAGKIMNVSNQNNENITIELIYVQKTDFEAYVSALKQNGYTVDADESRDSYTYDYRAYSQNGDYVEAYMTYDGQTAMVYMEKAADE